jgi:hypothetical protein
MLRIPHCLDNLLTVGGKVVSPTHRPHFTPQKDYYFSASSTHFCQRLSKPHLIGSRIRDLKYGEWNADGTVCLLPATRGLSSAFANIISVAEQNPSSIQTD